MTPQDVLPMVLTRPDGLPMQFHLEVSLPYQERDRLRELVAAQGGEVVTNPARHPHAVTIGEGAPGSRPRPPISDTPDAFSSR